MTTQSGCPQCGTKVAAVRIGRPRVYCGDVCKRMAEYELRRAQARLQRAETKEQDARLKVATDHWQRGNFEKAATFWAAETEHLKGQLRELLSGISTDEKGK